MRRSNPSGRSPDTTTSCMSIPATASSPRMSASAVFSIRDAPPGYDYPSFIAMDQPRHAAQRKTVSPMFTPDHLDQLAVLIRERAGKVLDALPRGETFDFVDRVSIELTTQMLATLFDFPSEERRKLTRWSDVSTALPKSGVVESMEQRRTEMDECAAYFANLWNERVNAAPRK